MDQRGAGRSLPLGELREFSPDNLVADIDSLRKHLGIGKWHMVFGGSWGSTLALRYAQAHAADVGSLVLRGIYFETHEEHRFSRGREGVGRLRPEEYDEWAGHLPAEDRHDPLPGYLKLLTCGDKEIELAAAKAYERYNSVIGQLIVPPGKSPGSDDSIWSHARIECYHHVKFARPDYEHFLGRENIEKVKHIPLTIVQGRYDIICTPRVAYELHKAWPSSRLFWIDAAGHSQNVSLGVALLHALLMSLIGAWYVCEAERCL